MSDIKKIKEDFILKLKENLNLNQVNEIKTELFGKNGLISSQFKKLGTISENERKNFAADLNFVKNELQNLIIKKIKVIEINSCNSFFNKFSSVAKFFLSSSGIDPSCLNFTDIIPFFPNNSVLISLSLF